MSHHLYIYSRNWLKIVSHTAGCLDLQQIQNNEVSIFWSSLVIGLLSLLLTFLRLSPDRSMRSCSHWFPVPTSTLSNAVNATTIYLDILLVREEIAHPNVVGDPQTLAKTRDPCPSCIS